MSESRAGTEEWLSGPLLQAPSSWPLTLAVLLCDLRPRFLDKGRVGRGYRAVARNGRVLLASDRPLAELANQWARMRMQTWHRTILPGEAPQAYGVLVCIHAARPVPVGRRYRSRLEPATEKAYDLALEVGGRMVLAISPMD